MRLRLTLLTVCLCAVFIAGCAPAAPTATPTASAPPTPTLPPSVTRLDPPVELTDFTLTNQSGEAFHLSDLQGHPTLLAFGYTHCPDICPLTLAHFKRVKQELGADGEAMRYVFISVDGFRDTPERLKSYLEMFDPEFIGLSGEDADTRAVTNAFSANYVLNNAGGLKTENYTVDHTATRFLIGADGRLQRTYSFNATPAEIVADLRDVLQA